MARLILTFEDSAAGALKQARLADRVLAFGWRFVWGALPSPRWLRDNSRIDGLALYEFCERFDAIDLWVDPEPNAQLQLIWLLDRLRRNADVVARLSLVQTDFRIGASQSDELAMRRSRAVPIHTDHLEIARKAWTAWRAPTPEAWFELLAHDLSALPQLRNAVLALLEELPMRTSGLGATELQLLEFLAAVGQVDPFDLFIGNEGPNVLRTYGYWDKGELLDGLARCPKPAVAGLAEGPFDDVMHADRNRHDRYRKSQLSLTDLGKAVLAQSDDFRRHNPIHRWWGGTELTNDRLWRWDPEERRLIAP